MNRESEKVAISVAGLVVSWLSWAGSAVWLDAIAAPLYAHSSPECQDAPSAAAAASPVGEFIGWFRLTDGSDIPLWIHVESGLDGTSARFSLPTQGSYDLPADSASIEKDRISFERTSKSGQKTTFELVAKGEMLEGRVLRDDKALGSVRCRRAALRPVRGDGLAEVAGCYRTEDGACLRISTWAWKELRCLDLSDGSDRTLFLDEKGDLCAGSSLYAAARIEARYSIVRDSASLAIGLVRIGKGKDREYRKIHFVERELEAECEGKRLSGTLLCPEADGPLPTAVILGGSDVEVRSDTRWEAEILGCFGLATLTYDLSGRGKSTGQTVQRFTESASDLSALLGLLAVQPECQGRRIGLCGTSRGGWLGPLVAARDDRVAFLILLSAPAVSPKVQLTSCRLNFMRAAGHGPDEIEEARSYLGLLWQCGRSDADWERYLAKRQVIDSKGWIPLLQGPAARDSEDLAWQELNLAYDPGPILKEVRCPVLCLFGAADRIVEPCVNAPLLAVAFAAAKNPDWTIQIVPGASHGLTLVDPQSPQRERPVEDESGFAPTVWETVRQWLRSHTSA